jgi:hypothetical protein
MGAGAQEECAQMQTVSHSQRDHKSHRYLRVGKNEIVMAAESLCQLGDPDGQYNASSSKIRTVGSVAFGFAGARCGFGLFDTAARGEAFTADDSLNEGIKRFIKAMGSEYRSGYYRDDVRFLACGIDGAEPLIYVATCVNGVTNGPSLITEGRIAIGLEKHGALHFVHRYHHRGMTTNELAFLAYFSIAEVIFHDARVKKPIDVFLVRQGAVRPLAKDEIALLEAASKNVAEEIGKALMRSAPDLTI